MKILQHIHRLTSLLIVVFALKVTGSSQGGFIRLSEPHKDRVDILPSFVNVVVGVVHSGGSRAFV